MIEGLEHLLENSGQPGLAELRELLSELMSDGKGADRFIDQQMLQPRGQRVLRLRFGSNGTTRSVIIKRLKPEIALRNELVTTRWLPAIDLEKAGPPLLGSAAARSGHCVWHVYDDLGRWELDPRSPGQEQAKAAVDLIARLHTGFAGHALLGEIRLHGGDLGIHFYESNVRDAIAAMEALQPPQEHRAVCERLLDRLSKLRAELPRRAEAMGELAGPETLLHGDLWAINVFVIPAAGAPVSESEGPTGSRSGGWHARLIDWDHAAVGPATYDLSTFLLRFPASERPGVLELYRGAVSRAGWRLPSDQDLNGLFETHEYARFANRIIWPAIALAVDEADWGWAELAEVESWFERFEPVLCVATETKA
jgi:thiamine kinase-like enzyme